MSTILSTIRNNYAQDLPTGLPMKATQGFVATAAISLITGRGSSAAVLLGCIAVTATVIETLTRPIIRAIFPDAPFVAKLIQICTPKMAALGLAASLFPWIHITYGIAGIASTIFALIGWLCLNHEFYERNVAMVEIL